MAFSILLDLTPLSYAAGNMGDTASLETEEAKNAETVCTSQIDGMKVDVEGYSEFVHFTDITSQWKWARDAINYVAVNGYMTGTAEGKFSPEGKLTKVEILVILRQLTGGYSTGMRTPPYKDVKKKHWYYDAVCWGYGHSLAQIIQSSSNEFAPTNEVTRVQIAQLMWQLACDEDWAKTPRPNVTLQYTDIKNLSSNSVNAIKWCKYSEIMGGTSATTFSPRGSITRAEMAQICYKLDKFIASDRTFIVGTDYTNKAPGYNHKDWTDTSMIPRNIAKYYKQMGYDVKATEEPNYVEMGSQLIKSKIVFLAGHGNNIQMQWNCKQSRHDYYKTGVGAFFDWYDKDDSEYHIFGLCGNMDFVDLIVFMGCNTALESEFAQPSIYDDSIAQIACKFGAKVSIGWTDSITLNDARAEFAENFSKELASGKTVKAALRNATNNYSYTSGSNIEKWAVYYSDKTKYDQASLKLQSSSNTAESSAVADAASWNLLETYQGCTQLQGEDLASETAAVLHDIDNSFDRTDYHPYVYEHNDGSATIVFIRVVGGFETDYEYRVGVEGNEMISVLDHTKELTTDKETHILEVSSQLGVFPQDNSERGLEVPDQADVLAEALRLAREQTQSSPNKLVGAQRYNYFYDVEQDRPFIMIFTDYTCEEPEMKGTDLYEYDLVGQEGLS